MTNGSTGNVLLLLAEHDPSDCVLIDVPELLSDEGAI